MPAEGETDFRRRLANRIRARRDEMGLSQQALADRAGVGVNTIIRMEQADFAERRTRTWAPVEEALGWSPRFFDHYLAGEIPDDLKDRYKHTETVVEGGRVLKIVEDMLLKVYMAGGTDQTFEDFDRTRRRLVEVLKEEGIEIAERHTETSPGTSEGP